ncbi:hypothetical protein SAMN02982927_03409 [Sporolactobacillus nakayamae]|uniref:Uncharacterized protein n=1 Tax=Sporolactobacillus nakayamae TaxID=269670 RepID=A0A1I2WAK2_9BACL|nr:hypothetical protein SAMN02982927_03409 [Sporolactobacillus nakayamae]
MNRPQNTLYQGLFRIFTLRKLSNKKGYQLIRACTFSPPENEQDLRIPISRVPNGIELCLKHGSYVKDKHIIEVDEEATS